jgi:hypothetical protein
MSVPMPDTTFGDIIYKGKKYRILSNPLNKEIREKVTQYKREKGIIFSSEPWNSEKYSWEIRENSLYLKKISVFQSQNLIPIFFNNKEEIFAKWYSGSLKVLVEKKQKDIPNQRRSKLLIMKIKALSFKNGILIKEKELTKKVIARKSLKELGYNFD